MLERHIVGDAGDTQMTMAVDPSPSWEIEGLGPRRRPLSALPESKRPERLKNKHDPYQSCALWSIQTHPGASHCKRALYLCCTSFLETMAQRFDINI